MGDVKEILENKSDSKEDFYSLLNCNSSSTIVSPCPNGIQLPDTSYTKKYSCLPERDPAVNCIFYKVEQIQAEYKILALQYHPDKNNGNKSAEAKFQQLNEAKEILCDPGKRIIYDKWRNSGICISYKNWVGMKDHVQQTMHWVIPKTKDRMLIDGSTNELNPSGTSTVARRASEGGAALYRGKKDDLESEHREVMNKFRNYEI